MLDCLNSSRLGLAQPEFPKTLNGFVFDQRDRGQAGHSARLDAWQRAFGVDCVFDTQVVKDPQSDPVISREYVFMRGTGREVSEC